jgi:hypothetical protein
VLCCAVVWCSAVCAEPFSLGKAAQRLPSTAFCLLYKLFTMKMTKKQMKATLNHPDSPYIRGVGFLFLRYGAEPKTLWDWFSPYLDDPQVFTPGGDKSNKKYVHVPVPQRTNGRSAWQHS